MNAIVQRLDDENEVKRLIVRMSLGMDLRDYSLFRASLADSVQVDIPPLAGDAVCLEGALRADDYARNVIDLLSEFAATQHVSTNHDVTVEGDQATCICYTLATHLLPSEDGDQWSTIGARYNVTAQRTPIGWKIIVFRWTRIWSSGNDSVWQEAGRRIDAKKLRNGQPHKNPQ